MLEKVINIDTSTMRNKIVRAGCIPYVIVNGVIKYCLGFDRREREFTDFGGGFSIKNDNIPQIGALRELREESLGIFQVELRDIANLYCIHNEMSLIIFVEISEGEFRSIAERDEFRDRSRSHPTVTELSDICFMTAGEFRQVTIYDKVKFVVPFLDEIEVKLLSRSFLC